MRCMVCKDNSAEFIPAEITKLNGYPHYSCCTCQTNAYSPTSVVLSDARPDAAWSSNEGSEGRERFESRLKAKIKENAAKRVPLNISVMV